MALSPGTTLGPYQVVDVLGVGGMGEVYRARDTRLDRTVALKVLPAAIQQDPERQARFEREAKAISQLNHPHICTLHDVGRGVPTSEAERREGGEADRPAIDYLVMELLEGETLAARLARGPLPPAQALELGAEIADALDAAHRHGIIHRDLKPGNVMLVSAGSGRSGVTTAKLLDFGLAKLTAHGERPAFEGSASAPTVAPATAEGTILGTLPYMAPEQLEGRPADARTDLWALGAIVYEMLAGRRAFEGASQLSLIGSIMNAEPPALSALQPLTPPALDRVVRKCLAKHPDGRWDSARDVADELRWVAQTAATGAERPRRRIAATLVGTLLVFAAGVAVLLAWIMTREPASVGAIHAEITLPDGHALHSSPAISPDGRTVAFASAGPSQQSRLYVRRLTESFDTRPIPGSEDAVQPFFSPDGRQVAYFARGKLWRVALDGGLPVAMAKAPWPRGGTWGDDESIVFVPSYATGLWRVRAGGQGDPTLLLEPDGTVNYGFTHPRFLPGARELLFAVWGTELGLTRLDVARKERTGVAAGCWSNASYAPTGHIVFGCLPFRGEIEAVADERANPTTLHTRTVVQERVFADYTPAQFYYDLSQNGTLVYAPGDISRRAIVVVDLSGVASEPVVSARAFFDSQPVVSPDQKRLAYSRNGRIHVLDRERENETALTTEDGAGLVWHDRGPRWWPDGSRLVFYSNRDGNWDLYSWDSAGGGITPLLKAAGTQIGPLSISRNGTLAYIQMSPTTWGDIWLRRPDGTSTAWMNTPFNEVHPSFDPSGRFIAYVSDKSGSNEIYVRATEGYREDGTKVSTAGGLCPAWSPGGDRLFYREGTKIMAVAMRRDGTPAGKPSALFDGGWALGTAGGLPAPSLAGTIGFDVMPDGRHFLMVRAEPEAIPTRLHVIFNWFEILKSKMAR